MAQEHVSESDLTFWSEFFELYRNLPVLWSTKTVKATNPKHLRDRALHILLRKYRERDPSATVGCIRKLLITFRFEYRAELRVALEHQQSTGNGLASCASSLWYFDALNFLLAEEIDSLKAELQHNTEACPATATQAKDCLPDVNTSDTDIVQYCKSLATVMKLLSTQQLVYAKYHIDSILKCGKLGILNIDWPQIDVNLCEQPSGSAADNGGDNCEESTDGSTVIIPAKRFKPDQESCENIDHTIATMREVPIYDWAEYVEEYGLEINQDSNSSNEYEYMATEEGNQIDRISDSVTPFEISIIHALDGTEPTVAKRGVNSITKARTGPNENESQAATPQPELTFRRQCTMHYSHYLHDVVPHYSDEEFLLNFRMGRNTVQMLYNHLAATAAYRKLRGHGGYEAISPQTHVLAFLWFLGHDKASYRDVADRFSLSVSCLHSVICRVADAILTMKPTAMVRPDEGKKAESATAFATKCNISNVIGCVGGTQIKIDKPAENAERYVLWKGYHSIQLHAIIDENVRFVDVFVDYPDEPELLDAIKEVCGELRYTLIGTAEYPCLCQLLVPYRAEGTPLIEAQKTFNERLETVTNQCVRIFTHLRTRFRQLHHLKGRHLSRIVKLIKVCCILHNFASVEEIKFLSLEESDHQRELVSTFDSKHQSPMNILLGEQRRDRICSDCT